MKKQDIIIKWLNKEFGGLTKVVKSDKTFYVDDDGKSLIMYYQYSKNGDVYVNYNRIWQLLEPIFGLDYSQTREILTIWLEETYNLRGYTPVHL